MSDAATFNYLVSVGEDQRAAADRLGTASEELAREANGIRLALMPAPVAYDVLGNVKLSLGSLNEVVRHLPYGLRRSLDDPGLEVDDQDLWTGVSRNPSRQVEIASGHLNALAGLLDAAAAQVEAAQSALNGQGCRARCREAVV